MKKMQPFGFSALSMHDEQSLCYYMSVYKDGPKKEWNNVGPRYSCSWTVNCDPKTAYILNFIGDDKPWTRDMSKEFPDTLPWYKMNKEMNKKKLGGGVKSGINCKTSRLINIISNNPDLISLCKTIKGYKKKFYKKYPQYNYPSYITITDIEPKNHLPSTYTLLYSRNEIKSTKFITFDKLDLSEISLKSQSPILPKTAIKYNVGEHIFTKKSPDTNTLNYDDSYDIYVDGRDTLVKESAEKGVPYEKYMTACISAFVELNSILLDVGANVGTVSLLLSRLHKCLVTVVSFEPFPNTYSILYNNVIENNANNIVPINKLVGEQTRKSVSMADTVVVPPGFHDKKGKHKVVDIEKGDVIHFGAVQIGQGSTMLPMLYIDELNLHNLGAMKVDVEGAEPLVFYGARKTIERCMPVVVFEHNEKKVSPDMKKALGLDDLDFNVLEFFYSIGYRDLYELDIDDYMLVPPGRKQVEKRGIAKFKPVTSVKGFKNINKFNLYKFVRPRW